VYVFRLGIDVNGPPETTKVTVD